MSLMKGKIKQNDQRPNPFKSKTIQANSMLAKTQDNFKSRTISNVGSSRLTQNNLNHSKTQLKCGIDNKYLNSINYLSTCEYAKKRNLLYRQYCSMIRDYYIQFNHLFQRFIQKTNTQIHKHGKYTFLAQFKSFVHEFTSIFKDVSLVQVGYFENLQQDFARKQYSLEWSTNQFIDKLQVYKKSQSQFQATDLIHKKELNEIYLLYENLKKDQKDPYAFFNRKQSSKKANELLESLKKQQKTRNSLRKDLEEVYENSSEFQGNLIMYRQQLFSNKYKIMKKLTQISKNSRNSLMQFLAYLFECTSRKSEEFNKIVKKSHETSMRRRSKSISNSEDKLAVESFLIDVTNQYNRTIDQIQSVVKNVAEMFEELRRFNSTQIQNKKKVLQLMNTVYDIDENPDNQVSKTLNFYQDFCTKLFEINNGINMATNEFAKLKKQARKLTEITLSLLRNSKNSIFQKSMEGSSQEGGHNSQIQILLQKLSYDYPVTLIQNIYKDFQKNLSYLKNDASQKFHMKKRMVMDSMDISQFEDETLVQPKKRICKKQIWLWEKWQNQNLFKIDEFKILSLAQIKEFTTKIIIEVPDGRQTDRFTCSLESKGDTAGFLIISDKSLKFETSQGNCILTILLQEIEDAKIVVKMFGKIVSILTTNGTINLRGFIDGQIVIEAIEEVRSNSGAPLVKPPRAVIEITVEQLAFMEERKNKIKSELPKIQDFKYDCQIILENITIDHLYELIYSDKEVNIRGKKEANFFSYVMKKNGSTNYECTKYDSIGPKFYTHEEGVTFLNCPMFSTRIMNYDVKLPPVPFMPKYAHNREECKLFWISNEELNYLIHNNASGAPKAETFFIEVLHKIEKIEQKKVKVLFYWRIVFTEDSFLKSTIEASAAQESKRGIKLTMTDMKKYCNQMTSASGEENKGSDEMLQKDNEMEQERETSEKGGFLSRLIESVGEMIRKITNRGEEKNDGEKGETKKQSSGLSTNVLLIVLTIVLALNIILHFAKG